MTEQEILDFKDSIQNLSLEELHAAKIECDAAITKMIFDSDLMVKVAILTALIEEKEGHN